MGSILHFPKPHLEDYYILSPQWWFDSCALVISPSNVNELIAAGDSKNKRNTYRIMRFHGNWLLLWQHYHSNTCTCTCKCLLFYFYFSRAWFWVVEVPDDADYVFGEEGFLGTSSPSYLVSFINMESFFLWIRKQLWYPQCYHPYQQYERGREGGVHVHVRDETFVKELGHMYSKSIH